MTTLPRTAHVRALPIAARQFLLVTMALLVAQAIALALMFNGPPPHNAPVPVGVVADLLDPARPAAGAVGVGPPSASRNELLVHDLLGPPRPPPPDLDPAGARAVKAALVALTGWNETALVVHVRQGHVLADLRGAMGGAPQLGEGFYVARHLADGRLRVVESVLEPFPNRFHRRVLLLLAVGTALLLPLAWVFSEAMSRPARRFAAAAQRVGIDPDAPALPLRGPTELRVAAEAFNRMQARIHGLLAERNEMMAAIAHDLRTPLARLAFRLTELPEPEQQRAAADIDEMTSMIGRTLDFCRGLGGHGPREPLDFRLLVESIVDDYVDTGAPVAMTDSVGVTVSGDALALRRAIVNLVDNALKYGDCARIALHTADTQVRLDIDDDGPGIAPAMQEAALRPFMRLERSRGRETGGIGLGLTMARTTVADHGGDLVLRNRPEGGLRVSVLLPTVKVTKSSASRAHEA